MRILLLSILTILMHISISAQDITGKAFYTSFYQDDFKLDSEDQKDPLMQEMVDLLNQPFVDQYELEFTQEESLFKKLPKLEKPDPKKAQISVSMSIMGDDEFLYKNLKENKSINETELYGKEFLIQDDLEVRDWKLSNESKTIGEYVCFKATYIPKKDVDDDAARLRSRTEVEGKAEEIIAWYTPQIPIKNGPKNYGGLPGLILEVQEGGLKFLCTKIVLNPKEKINIQKPKQGKKVSQMEFKAIMDKKNEERKESFHTRKRRD